MAAGVGVVEEDGAWASTPVGNETSTDTVAVTNRESDLNPDLSRPAGPYIETTTRQTLIVKTYFLELLKCSGLSKPGDTINTVCVT